MERINAIAVASLALALCFSSAEASEKGAAVKGAKIAAQAATQFTIGNFRQAKELFEKAYIVHRKPSYLFNMGQCHKRLGGIKNLKKAVFYYEAFVNTTDSPALGKKVSKRMAKVRRKIKRLEAERRAPTPIYKRWWFWTVVGVAATGAVVATVALQPEDQSAVPGSVVPAFIKLP